MESATMRLPAILKRLLFSAAAVAVLALVFVAYLQPSFVVDLANRIVMCL
jgi:hypothetical protein